MINSHDGILDALDAFNEARGRLVYELKAAGLESEHIHEKIMDHQEKSHRIAEAFATQGFTSEDTYDWQGRKINHKIKITGNELNEKL